MSFQRFKSLALLLVIAFVVAGNSFSGLDRPMEPPAHWNNQKNLRSFQECCDDQLFQSMQSQVRIQPAVISFRVNSSGRLISDPMQLSPQYRTYLKQVAKKIPTVTRL